MTDWHFKNDKDEPPLVWGEPDITLPFMRGSGTEPKIYEPDPGQSVYDMLCGIAGALRESMGLPQISIISGKAHNLLLRHQSRINKAARRHKIVRKQKRAAFRRRKKGLA
jgi:hypothetical protein